MMIVVLLPQTAFAATVGEQRPASECQAFLKTAYDAEIADFLVFLESHFANKSSNSTLTNLAIVRYTELKKTIEAEFATILPEPSGSDDPSTAVSEFSAYEKCSEMTELYLRMAKEQMIRHIQASSAAKRTTIMLEKYQAINAQLNNLNFEISQMYAGFLTFKNKLPGFLSKCITN